MIAPADSPSEPGTIYTFYSYKGGVGRSMALANVAALLSRRGKRVLVVDWDLEAPGLENYFSRFLPPLVRTRVPGVIDLILAHAAGKPLDWRSCLLEARAFDGAPPVSIVTAGQATDRYIDRMRSLDWERLFAEHQLGAYLERLRDEWKAAYDFVLIDSRTGITDTGGICTIHLPDALVLLFTANEQSLAGVKEVILRARRAHASLPVDRRRLVAIPVPARDESQNEHELAHRWQARFASELAEFYKDWIPKDMSPESVIEILKVPYKAYWSFGEPLPVVDEGTNDPRSLGFAYELLTRLIASGLQWEEVQEGKLGTAAAEQRAITSARKAEEAEERARRAERDAEEQRREAEERRRAEVAAKAEVVQLAAQQAVEQQQVIKRWRVRTGLYTTVVGVVVIAGAAVGLSLYQKQLHVRAGEEARALVVVQSAAAAKDPLEAALLLAELSGGREPQGGLKAALDLADKPIPETVLHHPVADVLDARFSPDGKHVVTAGGDGVARVFATDGRGDPVRLDGHAAPVNSAVFSPDGSLVVTASEGGTARLWTAGGEQKAVFHHGLPVRSAAFSSDGKWVITTAGDGSAALWDVASGKRWDTLRWNQPLVGAAFNGDGTRVVALAQDEEALLWPTSGGGRPEVLARGAYPDNGRKENAGATPGRSVLSSDASVIAAVIAVTDKDEALKVFRVEDPGVARLFRAHGLTTAIAVEGDRAAAGASDGVVRAWSATTGEVGVDLGKHEGPVTSVAFNADRSRVASASDDGTARTYGLGKLGEHESGPLLRGHDGPVLGARFSPDGALLLTFARDGTARVWPLAPGPQATDWAALLEQFRRSTSACLVPAQRLRPLGETEQQARAAYEACERSFGRTPLEKPVASFPSERLPVLKVTLPPDLQVVPAPPRVRAASTADTGSRRTSAPSKYKKRSRRR